MTPSEAVAAATRQGLDWLLEPSPVTGNQRFAWCANTVMQAVDAMGGVASVAAKFGVEPIEVERWIDNQFIPTRFALQVRALFAWTLYELQTPTIHPNRCWGVVACNSATSVPRTVLSQ
jgi:hypothetical protein